MAKPTGFMEYPRREPGHRPVEERVRDFSEVDVPHPEHALTTQAARCMDCGIPFCHSFGCPVKNRIPEFNDLVYRGKWREASENLHSTNNFPEITGRVCPAPCEAACTLAINDQAVTIKHIEFQIAERAFAEGWVVPQPPGHKSGRRVAVVGSGPAGLACAQQLARAGHEVVVFEKDDRVGGLLRYGIPDFKLEKQVLDRRLKQLAGEGVKFETAVNVGQDVSDRYLRKMFDAICLTIGAGKPRPLNVPGADLNGVHFAMRFLTQQNRLNAGDQVSSGERICARDKVVVVIGGGDTGSDCIGTSLRQGAKQVHQWEILDRPPDDCNPETPWPLWPRILRTSSSQEEGCLRQWNVLTRKLTGINGALSEIHACEVEWVRGPRGWEMKERAGSEFVLKADLILLAMGFLGPQTDGLVAQLGCQLDERGNVKADENHMSSVPGVFAAGDTRRGQSLVVWAIREGREAARGIDQHLRANH